MLKLLLTFILVLLTVVVLSNVFSQHHDCSYSNYKGSFTFEERNFQNRDFMMCLKKFDEFKKTNNSDTILYRICVKKGSHFWNYADYLFKEKYRLPYMNWEEIEVRRGELENKTGFQDF